MIETRSIKIPAKMLEELKSMKEETGISHTRLLTDAWKCFKAELNTKDTNSKKGA